jgi:glycosyltransferase involved in cell wall biosynthesis
LGEADFSGLPTYSAMFLEEFKTKEMVVVNIIADPSDNNEKYEYKEIGAVHMYNCYLPSFLSVYKPSLEDKIVSILGEYRIDKIVMPDYLVEEYMERVDERVGFKNLGIKKVLFVHLLYTGLMNKFLHEPYFNDHLLGAMTYLGKNCHTEWKAIVTSDIIICNSQFTANEVIKYYGDCGLSNKTIYAVPLGTVKDKIPFQPQLEGNKWAYFGRLDSMKGLWYISKDMVLNKELYQENPPLIIGDGMLEMLFMKAHFFEGLVNYQGLKNKKELAALLKDVKYCIFPSIYEPYGLALNEAMAMGKICIISNDASGMHEQVSNIQENGIVFDFRKDSIVNFIKSNTMDLSTMPDKARASANNIKTHFKRLAKILFN